MELLLILAAVAACATAGVAAAAMIARARRAPLRMDHEIDRQDEDLLLTEIGPARSPIDRSGAVLDLEPLEPGRGRDGRRGDATPAP